MTVSIQIQVVYCEDLATLAERYHVVRIVFTIFFTANYNEKDRKNPRLIACYFVLRSFQHSAVESWIAIGQKVSISFIF